MDELENLRRLCERGQIVRENYYSTTYRTQMLINGDSERIWDVQCIIIPFPPVKEAKLKARFGVTDSELEDFYTGFAKEIRQHLSVTEELRQLKDEARLDNSTVYYEMRKGYKTEDGGYELFLITKSMDALMGSEFITDDGAVLSSVYLLAMRLLQSVKNYNDSGYSIGTIDLDSFLVDIQSDKKYIKNGFFPAATSQRGALSSFTKDLKTHMDTAVAIGTATPSYAGDICAVCSIILSMLDGRHPNTVPDLTRMPKYCSPELYELLKRGINGDGVSIQRELMRRLKEESNCIKNGEIGDVFIPFAPPDYFAEYHRIDTEAAIAAEAEKQSLEEDIGGNNKSKIIKTIPILLLMFAVLGGVFWLYLRPMLWPAEPPAVTETPAAMPVLTPTPEPDSDKLVVTSRDAGLFSYNGLVVDAHGIPSGRFYINDNGDIECDPSKIPARFDELELTDNVVDLQDRELTVDFSEDTVELSISELVDLGISPGSMVIPTGWDMDRHLRKVEKAEFIPTKEQIAAYSKFAKPESIPKEGDVRIELNNEDFASVISDETDIGEFFANALCTVLSPTVEITEENKAKLCESLSPEEIKLTLTMTDSEWYEQYRYCDDATYEKLRLILREPECDVIKTRTTEVNGDTSVLYYDDDGNTYTEEEYKAQEALKAEIAETKAEFDAYKTSTEPVIMVPSSGVEEYVYTESIAFTANPVTLELKLNSAGYTVQTSFILNVQLTPADATCREVYVEIDRQKGLCIPYRFNADYITGEHNTYEQLTELTLDFSHSDNGSIGLALEGSEAGEYKIGFASLDGKATAVLDITVDKSGEAETNAGTPSPTPTPYTPSGNGSGGGWSGGGGYNPQPTPVPYLPQATPTPVPTLQPTAEPETFTVYPEAVTLKVGETVDLCPSMSCTWSCSNPSVAVIGGEQGRTVTAIAPGTCTITARNSDGTIVSIVITVAE